MFYSLKEKEIKLAEKYKDTCLLMQADDSRNTKEAVKDYNKKHHTSIDYRWCAVFRYLDLNKLKFRSNPLIPYKQFIIL